MADKCKFKVNIAKNGVFLEKFNYPTPLKASKTSRISHAQT
ncbi:hypothetical protein IFVP177_C1330126 [Vibrio parahaemolyticus]|nr:hypothetical protein D046_3685 [Vibrio parahaemolyticus V-223/04]